MSSSVSSWYFSKNAKVRSGLVHLLSIRFIKMRINFSVRQILAPCFHGGEVFTSVENYVGKWKIVSDQVRPEGTSSGMHRVT